MIAAKVENFLLNHIASHILLRDPYAKFCQNSERCLDKLLKNQDSYQVKNIMSESNREAECVFHARAYNHFADLL